MDKIINMILRQLTRRFVNMGVDKSMSALNNKMKSKDNSDDQPPLR